MNKLLCIEPSKPAIEFFKTNAADFLPVKKFTAFFDSENFLLTKYTPSNAAIHTIIENTRGDLMEFSCLTCGYGGGGPHAAAEVLRLLGIEKAKAESISFHDGLQIEFSMETPGFSHSINTDTFFNGSVRHKEFSGLNLDRHSRCNVITRDVYLINPEMYHMNGLINCLHVMKPVEFEYMTGKNAYLAEFFEISELTDLVSPVLYPSGTDGMNLIIRGERFDVKCFISNDLLYGTLNAVYAYLTKVPLFDEKAVIFAGRSGKSFLDGLKFLLNTFGFKRKITHRTIPVDDKELKRDVG